MPSIILSKKQVVHELQHLSLTQSDPWMQKALRVASLLVDATTTDVWEAALRIEDHNETERAD